MTDRGELFKTLMRRPYEFIITAFAMVELGQRTRLVELGRHAPMATRRFFGIPDYFYYAVADGIREILGKRRGPPFAFNDPPDASEQADLLGFD